jgi:hypothetical protein
VSFSESTDREEGETYPVTTDSLQELRHDEESLRRRRSNVRSGRGESKDEESEVLQKTREALTAQSTRSYQPISVLLLKHARVSFTFGSIS